MPPQRISAVLIPLRDNGGNVRAYALVDPADSRRVSKYRWHLRNREGYVATTMKGHGISLQRFLLGDTVPADMTVDHVNGWRLDNRRANLRIATTAENAQNQGSRGGSSRHRGVTWDKARQKWMARAMLNGKGYTIGRFDDEEVAAVAAAEFRAKHMPFSTEAAA
jgi:hypothetical protein